MAESHQFKIVGGKLQDIFEKHIGVIHPTHLSDWWPGEYQADLLRDEIYEVKIVDMGFLRNEYDFNLYSFIAIKKDSVFKKWYQFNANHFGDWVTWKATSKKFKEELLKFNENSVCK